VHLAVDNHFEQAVSDREVFAVFGAAMAARVEVNIE